MDKEPKNNDGIISSEDITEDEYLGYLANRRQLPIQLAAAEKAGLSSDIIEGYKVQMAVVQEYINKFEGMFPDKVVIEETNYTIQGELGPEPVIKQDEIDPERFQTNDTPAYLRREN